MPVTYQETLKPRQVETPLDLYFFRPVAYLLVRLALPTPLSANGMTVISIVVGLAGAALLAIPEPRYVVTGSLLLLLYGILDCADGQLARARGTSSRLGRILDGMSDYVVGSASGVAIALELSATAGRPGVYLALGGLGSVILQGTLFDYFKNRYLALSEASYREGDDLEETERALAELRGRGAAFPLVAVHVVYATFLRVQRAMGGGSEGAPRPRVDGAAYAARLAPVARGWALLGPSTHVAAMGAFACAGHLAEYIGLRLTVGNLAMVGLWLEQRRRERGLVGADGGGAERKIDA